MFAGETAETIKAALDELQEFEPVDSEQGARVLRIRDTLLQELRTIETQGRLL